MALTKATYSMINGAPINAYDYGVVGDGVADDTAALNAAIAAGAAQGKTVLITGTLLITSTITVPDYSSIQFEGAVGEQINRKPKSYIIKAASMTTPALSIAGESVLIRGGGVVGQPGNTGDNVEVLNHTFRWEHGYSEGAGRDGIRIGDDDGGSPNSNNFYLVACTAYANGRDGINVTDNLDWTSAFAAPNANSGNLIGCFMSSNGRHGLYCGNSFGNTVTGCLVESNVSQNVYVDRLAVGWTFIGGDYEFGESGSGATGSDLTLQKTDYDCTLDAGTDEVTCAAHGLVNGTSIFFSKLVGVTGASPDTLYFVISATTDTFKISTTQGGSAVDITVGGTGKFFILRTHSTRGAHKVLGVNLGALPSDEAYQTDQQWIVGSGFGAASGLRPGYNEIQFTPTLEGGTLAAPFTLSQAIGRAVKVGRMVTIFFDCIVSADNGATGTLRLGNLPYEAVGSTPASYAAGLVSYVTMPASRPNLTAAINGYYADFYGYGATDVTQFVAVDAAAQGANFASSGRISGTITYLSTD